MKAYHDGIRSFFAWCAEEGEIPEEANPMRRIKAPIVPQNPPPVLHPEGVRSLLDACEGRSFEERRDRAIVWIFYDAGLRLAELVGMTLDDVDLERRTVRVLGKGRRERVVPLG